MDAAYSVKTPTNYLLSGGDVLPEDQEIAVISVARSDLDRIAEKITHGGDNSFEKGPLLMNIRNSVLHPLLKNRLRSQGPPRFRRMIPVMVAVPVNWSARPTISPCPV